jgi:PAS domain S-box-containing protein
VMGNRAGVIQWANSGWRDLIGLRGDESTSKPIGSLLDRFAVDPSVVSYVRRRFLAGEVSEVEFPFSDVSGQERWLRVRVNPARDRDGDVSRFVAVAQELPESIGRDDALVEECELSELVCECAQVLQPELGSRTSFDPALCEDLPPAYGNRDQLAALVRYFIRRGAHAIDDEWGTISLTTGLVGLGDEPIGSRYLAAGMPVGSYAYIEVHDTGLTDLAEARSRLADPFLRGRLSPKSVSFPNAAQFVEGLGGRVQFEHDAPFGTAISIVLPA